ncbi:MAG: acyl-CoA thioester hydrolase/BAAT C-terminal domain-containing protein [Bacteroidia bacterium]
MKTALTLIFSLTFLTVFGQIKTTIYCFPGQGANKHIFDSLSIDTSYCLKIIEYETPRKNATLNEFALQFCSVIDTTQPFVLLGVSLGGMICVELAEVLKPQKTIIISSAKNRNELPFRYKFQKAIPLHKIFSGSLILAGAKLLQPIVEPDRRKNKATFKQMLASKNPTYMKRTVGLIINWERIENSTKIYHIQGTNDHTLPLKKIKNVDHTINNGSHLMTLTKAKEVSLVINKILTN